MVRRLIDLSVALILALSPIASGDIPLMSAPTKSKVDQVAGHHVVKVFDPKDVGIDFFGPNQIFQDRSGRFWIGYLFGLALYDEKANRWKSFSKKMGELSSYGVDQICESGDGKLWFVSNMPLDNHVTCFDGERWQSVETVGGTRYLNRVTAMFSGRNGRVWFADGNKLVAYDRGKWISAFSLPEIFKMKRPRINYPTRGMTPEPLWGEDPSQFTITAGFEDSKGDIWLGTWGGIFRFHKRRSEWRIYPEEIIGGTVSRIYEDRIGRIWFALERNTVSAYDKTQDSWTSYDLLKPVAAESVNELGEDINGNKVLKARDIYQDRAGLMMFATRIGLLTFKESENRWNAPTSKIGDLPRDSITAIKEDDRSRIWIGTSKRIVVLEQ